MEILAVSVESALNILYVALGLGLVIFFHELGHFAVAKWCDVNVERFSIGFGPIIWSKTWGETEYALSLIPFGGYVKMLGQDDADPAQLASEEIALDPRSYSAKPVWQRMAIISAGVIMNVATALLFFATAFGLGVSANSPVVGAAVAGTPAWKAGLKSGDRITRINDRDVATYGDIPRAVALSEGSLAIYAQRGHETLRFTLMPDESGTRRQIGVLPSHDRIVFDFEGEQVPPAAPGTSAAQAQPPFEAGDVVQRINGTEVANFFELQQALSARRAETVEFQVERKNAPGTLVEISVEPNPFRTLGLWMDFGQIAAVRQGSPAAGDGENGLKLGDKILSVNGEEVGTAIDPMKLPDHFAALHGQEVEIKVKRPVEGAGSKEVTVLVTPDDEPGWLERPLFPGEPLSIPSLGVAFHITATVMKVEESSPSAGIIEEGESIKQVDLLRPKDAPPDGGREAVHSIKLGADEKNWAYAFWLMQRLPAREIKLTVSKKDGNLRSEPVVLSSQPSSDWFSPHRGIHWYDDITVQQADSVGGAFALAASHTRNSITDIYLTLRNLIVGRLSYKELHGPIGIAMVAYQVTQQGFSALMLFLGFLSVNLAVLNFLPIPVLDGGHMVFLCWEAVTRRKPSERVLVAATYCGMAFVLGLMALVLYLDVFVRGMSL
jgi:regulator of sigma E protease